MKNLKRIAFSALVAVTLFSCSKSDDELGAGANKNMKFTFTATGVNTAEFDYLSFIVVGGTITNEKTVWKVNGV